MKKLMFPEWEATRLFVHLFIFPKLQEIQRVLLGNDNIRSELYVNDDFICMTLSFANGGGSHVFTFPYVTKDGVIKTYKKLVDALNSHS